MNEYSFKENLLKIPVLNLFSTQLEIGRKMFSKYFRNYISSKEEKHKGKFMNIMKIISPWHRKLC